MGGLTFGGGYFGQYSQGGTVPVEQAALADVVVMVAELVSTVAVPALVTTVIVPPLVIEADV
jgi:hypothetical protein